MHEFPRRKSSDNGDHHVKPPLAERGASMARSIRLPRLDYRRAELPRFLVGAMHQRLIENGLPHRLCNGAPDDECQAGERAQTDAFEVQSITHLDCKVGLTLPIIAPSRRPEAKNAAIEAGLSRATRPATDCGEHTVRFRAPAPPERTHKGASPVLRTGLPLRAMGCGLVTVVAMAIVSMKPHAVRDVGTRHKAHHSARDEADRAAHKGARGRAKRAVEYPLPGGCRCRRQ